MSVDYDMLDPIDTPSLNAPFSPRTPSPPNTPNPYTSSSDDSSSDSDVPLRRWHNDQKHSVPHNTPTVVDTPTIVSTPQIYGARVVPHKDWWKAYGCTYTYSGHSIQSVITATVVPVVQRVAVPVQQRMVVDSGSNTFRGHAKNSHKFELLCTVTTHKDPRYIVGDNSAIEYLVSMPNIAAAESGWNGTHHWPWRRPGAKATSFEHVVSYFIRKRNIRIVPTSLD